MRETSSVEKHSHGEFSDSYTVVVVVRIGRTTTAFIYLSVSILYLPSKVQEIGKNRSILFKHGDLARTVFLTWCFARKWNPKCSVGYKNGRTHGHNRTSKGEKGLNIPLFTHSFLLVRSEPHFLCTRGVLRRYEDKLQEKMKHTHTHTRMITTQSIQSILIITK